MKARIEQIDAAAARPVLHVLIHAYARWDSAVTDGTLHAWQEYGQALRELAADRSFNRVFIDLSDYYAAAGVPGADPYKLITSDKVHQNDVGHAFMEDIMRELMQTPKPTGASGGSKIIILSPASPVPPESNVLAVDSFDRPDNTNSLGDADTGQAWSYPQGAFGISAGKAYCVTAGTATLAVGAADVSFQADVARPSANTAGIGVRAASFNNRIAWYYDGTNILLSVLLSNANTVRATVAHGAAVGEVHSLKLSVVGMQVKGYLDNVEVATYTLTSAEMSALTGTGVALRNSNSANGATFDNVVAVRP